MKRIYLDYASTTPTDPRVILEMQPYFNETFGNPSSLHHFGQAAKGAVEIARERVASLIKAKPEEIVFTSGGTESDNFAIKGIAYANEKKGNHIITSSIEHHAIIEPCKFLEKRGFSISYLPVDNNGLVNPDDLKKAMTDKTILISIMHANNEIGTIEPIDEIGKIAKEKGIYFHTDAVQSAGAIPIDVNNLNVDLLSMSAHKLYGPKGVGAVYVRRGTKMISFMHGGSQERNRRGSTENVPGIVGFGKACEIASKEMERSGKNISYLRDKLIKGLQSKINDCVLNGDPIRRLPNNVNVCLKYIEGESMLLNLDMEGIAASTGSACSSAMLEPSHVLLATGVPHEMAHGSIRFTLGHQTTEKEIDHLLEVFPNIVEKLRKMSPLYKERR